MATDGTVSKSEFARLRGVGPSMVTKWAKAGRLVLSEDGKRVNAAASLARIAEGADPTSNGGNHGNGRNTDVPAVAERGRPPVERTGPSFTQVRTAREAYGVKEAELDYLERTGKLVDRAKYDRALEDALRVIVSALESLAPRLGPKLVGLTDIRSVQNAIDDEVENIRKDAASTIRALLNSQIPTRQ